ncbi:MAG: hypothetical protein ACTS3T_24145 [Almyronema sp.]
MNGDICQIHWRSPSFTIPESLNIFASFQPTQRPGFAPGLIEEKSVCSLLNPPLPSPCQSRKLEIKAGKGRITGRQATREVSQAGA